MKKWENVDFVRHFYTGSGDTKRLGSIGLLEEVSRESSRVAINRNGGFKDQIRSKARRVRQGNFRKTFKNHYSFGDVLFAFGRATLAGEFAGGCCPWSNGRKVWVQGRIIVRFTDTFTDPLDVIERLYGSSTSPRAPRWLRSAANVGGVPFKIVGEWSEDFVDQRA